MKLRNITLAAGSIWLASILGGCSSELPEISGPQEAGDGFIRIETVSMEGETRAPKYEFVEGDRIGLFIYDKETCQPYTDNSMNVAATYGGSYWKMETDIRLEEGREAVVLGYYPYSTEFNGEKVTFANDGTMDILRSEYCDVDAEGNVSIFFRHVSPKQTFTITKDPSYKGEGVLDFIHLKSSKLEEYENGEWVTSPLSWMSYYNAICDIDVYKPNTGKVFSSQECDIYEINVHEKIPAEGLSRTVQLHTYGLPNTYRGSVSIQISVDGKVIELPKKITEIWHYNYGYNYNIVVKNTEIVVEGEINGHAYIDLGLPSGTKWATCNVGAELPTLPGNYYGWGMVEPQDLYTVESNPYSSMSVEQLNTKGVCVDGILALKFDAAYRNWGDSWRMPTPKECKELIDNCEWSFRTDEDGISYYTVTGPSGGSINLPIAGYYTGNTVMEMDVTGNYWTSKCADSQIGYGQQLYLKPSEDRMYMVNSTVGNGRLVRPVSD